MIAKATAALVTLLAAGVFSLSPALAADDKPDTPATLKGGKAISVDEAKGLLDKKGAAFFDTRAVINFGKGHIPGAAIVAYKEKSDFKADFDVSQDSFELAKLPADKAAKIVIYSDGPKGWKSYKAAVLAINAGHKNVMWMRDGFTGWSDKKFPVEQ